MVLPLLFVFFFGFWYGVPSVGNGLSIFALLFLSLLITTSLLFFPSILIHSSIDLTPLFAQLAHFFTLLWIGLVFIAIMVASSLTSASCMFYFLLLLHPDKIKLQYWQTKFLGHFSSGDMFHLNIDLMLLLFARLAHFCTLLHTERIELYEHFIWTVHELYLNCTWTVLEQYMNHTWTVPSVFRTVHVQFMYSSLWGIYIF